MTKEPPQGELEIPMSSQPEAGCSARPRGFLHARVGSHKITCGLESPHTTEILFAEVFPPRPKTRSLPAPGSVPPTPAQRGRISLNWDTATGIATQPRPHNYSAFPKFVGLASTHGARAVLGGSSAFSAWTPAREPSPTNNLRASINTV